MQTEQIGQSNSLVVEQGSVRIVLEVDPTETEIHEHLRNRAERALAREMKRGAKVERGYYDLTLYAGTTELDFETNIF